ncbi:hypothetical protein PTTG_11170, partial [Puccinia triticina 1-1 BBBD Race 1]
MPRQPVTATGRLLIPRPPIALAKHQPRTPHATPSARPSVQKRPPRQSPEARRQLAKGKRNFFSTLLSRASGSNSNPTSPGPSLFSGSASRNPFESTFNRPSNPNHHSRAPNHCSGFETYGTSNQATDPAH